ncbi:MAG: host attachment protein [Bauldia sp.]|nr:host attachment protein [Bauldia sp.]
MTKIAHGTWVVVADGKKVLMFRNKGDSLFPHFELMREFTQDNPTTEAQGADRPGRVRESASAKRSAVEATDWHQLAEDRFAARVADELYTLAHHDEFQRLVLVAPPRILGVIRHSLHPEVRERIVAEAHKTLTQHPVVEIERLLTQIH